MILDGIEKPLKVKLHSYCFNDQLLHLFLEQPLFVATARLGPFGNYGTHPLVDIEPALLDEVLNGLMSRVRMDLESGCQGSNRRKGLARLEFPAEKGLLSCKDHLIHDGLTRLKLKAEWCHMNTVTAMTRGVKGGSRVWMVDPACRKVGSARASAHLEEALSELGTFVTPSLSWLDTAAEGRGDRTDGAATAVGG